MRMSLPPEEPGVLLRDAERDIDGVLIGHLLAAPDFRDWVLTSAGAPPVEGRNVVVTPVRRSRKSDTGLDIVLTLGEDRNRDAVLISNRLVPAPRIARKARAEADAMAEAGQARTVRMLLIRPEAAAAHSAEADPLYDAVVTHDWLGTLLEVRAAGAAGELAGHLAHHVAVLARAMDVAARAIETTPIHTTEEFLDDYKSLLARAAPSLPPGVGMVASRPETDLPLMVFGVECLPDWPFLPQMRLAHHLREGMVSLTFYGWGIHLSELAQVMDPVLARTPFRLALTARRRPDANPGLMIVNAVPVLDTARPLSAQEDEARAGMQAADLLRRWFIGQRNTARLWAEIAGGLRPHERVSRFDRGLALS